MMSTPDRDAEDAAVEAEYRQLFPPLPLPTYAKLRDRYIRTGDKADLDAMLDAFAHEQAP